MIDSDYALFASILEAGSLSAAGRKLLISPAMVSKRLARLERRLGVRLVHRTTRKLALTGPGQRFHEDVTRILRSIEEAENRLIGIRDEPGGPLRVSAPTSFGRLHIAPRLHEFLAQYPRVELEFDVTDEEVDLFAGHVDLAVRITSEIPASVEAHRLAANRRVLCASPAYLERHGAPEDIAALQRHRLIAANGQLPWRLENGGQLCTVEGRSHVRTNSSEIVRELALQGVGIALRSLWDIDPRAQGRRACPAAARMGGAGGAAHLCAPPEDAGDRRRDRGLRDLPREDPRSGALGPAGRRLW
ncbi:MAG: LysR substrate-binding domain-containing protein [Sphingomonas sp.]